MCSSQGLRYLHESDLRVHGNLRSTNVLVTNLWVLRLTNFGLLELRSTNAAARASRDDKEDYQLYRSKPPPLFGKVLRGYSVAS